MHQAVDRYYIGNHREKGASRIGVRSTTGKPRLLSHQRRAGLLAQRVLSRAHTPATSQMHTLVRSSPWPLALFVVVSQHLDCTLGAPPSPTASPAPPLGDLVEVSPLSAHLSSVADESIAGAHLPASNAIDGRLDTLAASSNEMSPWLSVQVPAGSTISYVAVHNRDDSYNYQAWLSPFEVFVGRVAGDTLRRCGDPMHVPVGAGPFMTDCGSAAASVLGGATFVTLRLMATTDPRPRYLTIAELKVYALFHPPPPPPRPPVTTGGGSDGNSGR